MASRGHRSHTAKSKRKAGHKKHIAKGKAFAREVEDEKRAQKLGLVAAEDKNDG